MHSLYKIIFKKVFKKKVLVQCWLGFNVRNTDSVTRKSSISAAADQLDSCPTRKSGPERGDFLFLFFFCQPELRAGRRGRLSPADRRLLWGRTVRVFRRLRPGRPGRRRRLNLKKKQHQTINNQQQSNMKTYVPSLLLWKATYLC